MANTLNEQGERTGGKDTKTFVTILHYLINPYLLIILDIKLNALPINHIVLTDIETQYPTLMIMKRCSEKSCSKHCRQ